MELFSPTIVVLAGCSKQFLPFITKGAEIFFANNFNRRLLLLITVGSPTKMLNPLNKSLWIGQMLT